MFTLSLPFVSYINLQNASPSSPSKNSTKIVDCFISCFIKWNQRDCTILLLPRALFVCWLRWSYLLIHFCEVNLQKKNQQNRQNLSKICNKSPIICINQIAVLIFISFILNLALVYVYFGHFNIVFTRGL